MMKATYRLAQTHLGNVVAQRDCVGMLVIVTLGLLSYFCLWLAQGTSVATANNDGHDYRPKTTHPPRVVDDLAEQAVQRQLHAAGGWESRRGRMNRLIMFIVSDPHLWELLDDIPKADSSVWTQVHTPSVASIGDAWQTGQPFVYLPLGDGCFVTPADRSALDSHTNHTTLYHLISKLQTLSAWKKVSIHIDVVTLHTFLPTSIQRHQSSTDKNDDVSVAIDKLVHQAIRMQRVDEVVGLFHTSTNLFTIRSHRVAVESWINPTKPRAMQSWFHQHLGIRIPEHPPKWKPHPRGNYVQAIQGFIDWLATRTMTQLQRLPPLPHLARPVLEGQRTPRLFGITQIRNVAHTIQGFADNVLSVADGLLLLDTGSTDNTSKVIQERSSSTDPDKRIQVMQSASVASLQTKGGSDPLWDEGANYRRLLNWARKEGATHIISTDSDEYITVSWHRHDLLRNLLFSLPQATAITVPLFHVYNGTQQWISGPVSGWRQVKRTTIGWCDDGVGHRGSTRHHLNRTPQRYKRLGMRSASNLLGLVHFKFASLAAIHVKTMWYRHMEYDGGSRSRAVGSFYGSKMPHIKSNNALSPVPTMAWYGQEDGSPGWAQQWTESASWQWRIDMVHAWREKWKRQSKKNPFTLPKNWPFDAVGSQPPPSPPV